MSGHTVTYSDDVFVTGDLVYNKQANDRKWRGPGKVLGHDGQQVSVKHGSTYVKCHPCHLSFVKGPPSSPSVKPLISKVEANSPPVGDQDYTSPSSQ